MVPDIFRVGDHFTLGEGLTATLTKDLGDDFYEIMGSDQVPRLFCGIIMRTWPLPLTLPHKEEVANARDPTRRRTNQNMNDMFCPVTRV